MSDALEAQPLPLSPDKGHSSTLSVQTEKWSYYTSRSREAHKKSEAVRAKCPAEFHMDRERYRHVSCGFGSYIYPSTALTRIELKELLATFPHLWVGGPVPDHAFGGGDYNCLPTLHATYAPVR